MGENLIMNIESKGFMVACFNRTTQVVTNFIEGRAKKPSDYRNLFFIRTRSHWKNHAK